MAPLPSWQPTPTRQAILDFIAAATTPGHPDFIPQAERVAVFDGDGTLWPDRPMALQVYFLIDQIQAMAPRASDLGDRQPLQTLLERDYCLLQTIDKQTLLTLFGEVHAGLTPEEVTEMATAWWRSGQHPYLQRPLQTCLYQPMQELLATLSDHGFAVYVIASGSLDFARVVVAQGYGLAPEQVIGCSLRTRLEYRQGRAELVNLAEAGALARPDRKATAAHRHLGRRPVLAAGNGASDLALLHYTAGGPGRRLTLLLHPDPLDVSLGQGFYPPAAADLPRGGLVVSLQRDFAQLFPTEATLAPQG